MNIIDLSVFIACTLPITLVIGALIRTKSNYRGAEWNINTGAGESTYRSYPDCPAAINEITQS